MKFKLDENLGLDVARVLRKSSYDVSTVRDQQLGGTTDRTLYDVCRQESRCLVTLDMDFSNVLRFPPESTAGIIVLRVAGKATRSALVELINVLIAGLERETVGGRLWIIEPGRIRIHQAADPD